MPRMCSQIQSGEGSREHCRGGKLPPSPALFSFSMGRGLAEGPLCRGPGRRWGSNIGCSLLNTNGTVQFQELWWKADPPKPSGHLSVLERIIIFTGIMTYKVCVIFKKSS